ncbi:LOW QUALITY PROTEIN: hypothetical protein Q4I30_007826 [Leishmania utingensis]|uniref:Guanine nucleotide-binding protein subunit beta-like protein n=1 Tax=Leishmania utingensis TaxID=653362 RepID=A0AAW2ZTN1_9TRYP
MGCRSSSTSHVYDRRAYHDVAVALPLYTCGTKTSTRNLIFGSVQSVDRQRSHGNVENRSLCSDFYADDNEAPQREMGRRLQGVTQHHRYYRAPGAPEFSSNVSLRLPHGLQHTPSGHSRRVVPLCDDWQRQKKGSGCLAASVCVTPPSSLATSGSAIYVSHPSLRFDSQSELHLSEGFLTRSSLPDFGGWPWCPFLQGVPPCSAAPYSSKAHHFQAYSLHPCKCGHGHGARLVLFAVQTDILLSCSTRDRHRTTYPIALGVRLGRLVGHDYLILGGAVSPDGMLVATTSRDCTAVLWKLPSCKQHRSLTHPHAVHACRFSSSDTELATACTDGLCRIWTGSTTGAVNILVSPNTGFNGTLSSRAYSFGDKALLAGGSVPNVSGWDRQSFSALGAVFRFHHSAVLSVDAYRTRQDIVISAGEGVSLSVFFLFSTVYKQPVVL